MKKKQTFYSFFEEPLVLKSKTIDNTRDAGKAFIEEFLQIKDATFLTSQGLVRSRKKTAIGENDFQLLLEDEKKAKDLTTVVFRQMYQGVPVWDAAISVLVTDELQVLQASVSYREELKEQNDLIKDIEERLSDLQEKINADFISKAIDAERNALRLKSLGSGFDDIKFTINSKKPKIYQYHSAERQHEHTDRGENAGWFTELPEMALPEVSGEIKEGSYYGVVEVLFSSSVPWGQVNWRMMIEAETQSVLYLRILADNLNGYVYDNDAISLSGDASITPASPTATLNSLRTPRPLPGITASNPQSLTGEYVALTELMTPVIAAPTLPPGQDFDFDVNTDNFSAVNTYYHNDALFRMIEEMGFDMATYFDGTISSPGFPVPVDHRGFMGCVNACAPGNAGGDGSGGFHYGLVVAGQPVGISTCWRIVLHEFGHAVLWDNVHSPNLGFAHSVGDGLGAVLSDPRSLAPDRFMTFPWLTTNNPGIDRRHDRDVATGWAWGGTQDVGGYNSEQILATTHFRIYRALGGDHPDLLEQEFAARYTIYLVYYAVGLLTPATNPNSPEEWAAFLQAADLSTSNFEGQPRACTHKVVRWGFEKQGAYQPVGAPTPVVVPGAPPEVDIFINDGRNGEYYFDQDIYDTTEIWNRNAPDGGAAHQQPLAGQQNYIYAIIRNRGTETARRITVRAYRANACCCDDHHLEHLNWPQDFCQVHTAQLGINEIAPDGYSVVGPFTWIPESFDEKVVVIASTRNDQANAYRLPSGEKVALNHILPFDNNMAMRRM